MRKLCWFLLYSFVAAAVWAVPVTDGLIIHVSADSLNLSNNDPVTSWPDLAVADSVNGSLSTATNAANPVFKTSGWNGFPSVKFTRSLTQALESAQFNIDNTAGICVFIVASGGTTDIQRAVQVGRRLGGNAKVLACELSSNQSGVRYGNGTALTNVGVNPVLLGTWHTSVRQVGTLNARYDSLAYYVNNMTPLSMVYTGGDTVTNFDVAANNFTVGNGRMSSTWRSTDWYEGEIAEVIVYNKLLTQQQIQIVMNYITNKYNYYSAHNPSPSNNAVNQGTIVGSNVQVTLGWNTGLDPANPAVPNPNITSHYLYLVADEPNFLNAAPVATIPAGSPVQATASSVQILNTDKTYYWQVRESVSGSAANDPNLTIYGPVWKFESLKAVPIFNTQPANQVTEAGQTATFSINVTSISPVTYTWYKSPDLSNSTPVDDIDLLTNSSSYSIAAQSETEGYYFCKATNSGGQVVSNVAGLGIKKQVAHWTLDGLVAEQYEDTSGEVHHADPNELPIEGSFVPGVDPTETGQALNLTVKPLTAAWTQNWTPTKYTAQATVSAWVKWSGLATWTWQGLVNSRGASVDPMGDVRNWLLEITPAGILRVNAGGIVLESTTLPIGEWTHVGLSMGPNKFAISMDGMPVATQTPGANLPQNNVPVYVGSLARNAAGSSNTFNGLMDDVQIFNYAKTQEEVATMYSEVTEIPVCLNPNNVELAFDIAGGGIAGDEPDCLINLMDFAKLATEWANCGLYPAVACP